MLFPECVDLRMVRGAVVRLVDFVGREVGDIDVGLKARLERCTDFAEGIPIDAAEEVVEFDLRGTVSAARGAEAVGGGTEEAVEMTVSASIQDGVTDGWVTYLQMRLRAVSPSTMSSGK